MITQEELAAILKRVAAGEETERDRQLLGRSLLMEGNALHVVVQEGKYAGR